MISITKQQYLTSNSTYYHAIRNGQTYYLSDNYGSGVDVQQRYMKRNGTFSQRRVPDGKVRDELLAALSAHKAAPMRERLCTPMTVGQASIAAASVI